MFHSLCQCCATLLNRPRALLSRNISFWQPITVSGPTKLQKLAKKRIRDNTTHVASGLYFSRWCSIFGPSDTVFALSSGQGKCACQRGRVRHPVNQYPNLPPAVAVVRVTGPQSGQCLMELAGMVSPPKPRHAVLRKLSDPKTGDTIDHGLVLWFPGPHSFTGEDCVEFHVHGGPSVVLSLLTVLGQVPECAHAEPGDFTKRAFLNGKLDLTEVEGLADLIHAETEAQRKQALRQMEGDLARLYGDWTQRVLKSVAHVEAVIDFGEDENIEDNIMEEVRVSVEALVGEMREHLHDGRRGERLRSGVHVAILGAPNAGKSSLLNILCQRPAAIVSPHAGTTRDVLESALDISGFPVVLSDTAGLRQATDPVEQEGVRRALNRVESSDLCILIADLSLVAAQLLKSSEPLSLPLLAKELLQVESEGSSDHTDSWMERAVDLLTPADTIVVFNKTDLVPDTSELKNLLVQHDPESSVCWMSCKTGDGVRHFMDTLTRHLEQLCGNPLAGNPSITQARHRQHLTQCVTLLDNFLCLQASQDDMVLDQAAEELRMAIREIGKITGKVGVEEILDVVFRDFCIGK